MEKQILAALVHDRAAYTKLKGLLEEADVLSDQATYVFQAIDHYYETDNEVATVDKDWLKSKLAREHARHAQLFEDAVDALEPVSTDNIVQEFIELRRAVIGEQLADALIKGKTKEINRLRELYDAVEVIEEDKEDQEQVYIDTDLDDLLTIVAPENMIPIYPRELNERIGGGLPKEGGHMVLFGPPDSGKSCHVCEHSVRHGQQGTASTVYR